jgi:hypothetical protein
MQRTARTDRISQMRFWSLIVAASATAVLAIMLLDVSSLQAVWVGSFPIQVTVSRSGDRTITEASFCLLEKGEWNDDL